MRDWRPPRPLVWLALGLVFAVGALYGRFDPPLAVAALLDESAHAATAFLALGALRLPLSRPVLLGTLLGAVLIDVDHVPMEFAGWDILTRGTDRPYSHSLIVLAGLLLAALLSRGDRRQVALCAALGLATHLVRDMATGGVPLFWPLTARTITIPYAGYAALLLLAAVWSAWAWGREPDHRRRATTPASPPTPAGSGAAIGEAPAAVRTAPRTELEEET